MKHIFEDKFPSLRQLSLDTGIAYSSIYKIAHCEVSLDECQVRTVKKLASMYNMTLEEFYNSFNNRVIKPVEYVLAREAALEALGLFGFFGGIKVPIVFAEKQIAGMETIIVDDLSKVPTVMTDKGACASINYTVNDCIDNFNQIDRDAFYQSLNDYYWSHNASWSGLIIENMDAFSQLEEDCISYA